MDRNHINYVACVVEEGSISAAARRLNISQPALSTHIRKIEQEYGITIFQKNRRTPVLTDEGTRYLEFMSKMQELDKSFRRYISDSQELKTGEVRVGGTNLYTQCILPGAVGLFHSRYPGVRIRIVNERVSVLASMAAKGELDLFISSPGKQSSGIVYETLMPARMYLCVPSQYEELNRELAEYAVAVSEFSNPDIGRRGLDLKALEGCTFILLSEQQYMGRALRDLFRRHQVTPGDFIYADQAMTAYALTDTGAGISLMYDRTIERTIMPHHPVYYTLDEPEMEGDLYVAYAERDFMPVAAREFIRCLKEVAFRP